MMIKKIILFFLILMMYSLLVAQETQQDSLLLEVKDIDIYDPQIGDFLDVDIQPYAIKAWESYNAMDYETAAKYYLKLLQYDNSNANALYNLACCYGLLGTDSLAVVYIKRAYNAGFTDIEHIEGDPDFDGVRDSNSFISLLDSLETIQERADSLQGTLYFIPAETLQKCRIKFPDNYDPTLAYPLLIGLHGWGDNAENFIMLDRKFPQMNFIFVVPEAPYEFGVGNTIGYSWIEGWEKPEIFEKSVTLTEAYILHVISYITSIYNVTDVYLMGFSQGCWMTYYVGLNHPEVFSGLLCFGGELPLDILGDEIISTANKLPVYIVHGENDRVIPLEVGQKAQTVLDENGYQCELYIFEGAHEIPEEGFKLGFPWLGLIK